MAGISLPLLRIPPRPCSYLPDRAATDLIALSDPQIDSAMYQRMMDAGFRRSGPVFYKPDCAGCRECVAIRVPVSEFRPSRSQRRVLRRNADVTVTVDDPVCNEERVALYERYQAAVHDGSMSGTSEEYSLGFCHSPIRTIEMSYRVGGQLVGIGIVDVTPAALSSVYFYYEPQEARRSLGVFSGLMEIQECRRRALPHWYVGFYIKDCRKMSYKNRFRPRELLGADGAWRRAE